VLRKERPPSLPLREGLKEGARRGQSPHAQPLGPRSPSLPLCGPHQVINDKVITDKVITDRSPFATASRTSGPPPPSTSA
jgi:hypothetical protein